MRVLAILGSLQAQSRNRALLERARELAPAAMQLELYDRLAELPHFNLDLEAASTLPTVDAFRARLDQADALLIACPEYGFSLPGALKNAIDWVIGSGELEGKLVAVTAATAGPERGRLGLQALLQTLSAVSAQIVGGNPIASGSESDKALSELLATLAATWATREH
jgi:chromate reductase, NAD(P)H dehydrogenase (quinone)